MNRQKYQKPYAEMIGSDGNAFALMGVGTGVLRKLGLKEGEELGFLITSYAVSYGDEPPSTLGLLMNYFDMVHVGFSYQQEEELGELPSRDEVLDKMGNTPLHILISKNHKSEDYKRKVDKNEDLAQIENYLEHINDENCYGRTPLYYAKTEEDASFLIKNGANLWHKDMHGNLPIHVMDTLAKKAILNNLNEEELIKQLKTENNFGQNWLQQFFLYHQDYKGGSQKNDIVEVINMMRFVFNNPEKIKRILNGFAVLDESNQKEKTKKSIEKIEISGKVLDKEVVGKILGSPAESEFLGKLEKFMQWYYGVMVVLNPKIAKEEIFKNIEKVLNQAEIPTKKLPLKEMLEKQALWFVVEAEGLDKRKVAKL